MSSLDYELITDLANVPQGLVDSLAPRHCLILGRQFATVIEQGIEDVKVRYVVVKSKDEPVALIYLVETQVNVEYKWGPFKLPLKLKFLLCGHPIISADCGISTSDKRLRNQMLPQLLKVLHRVAKELGVSVVLLRDIEAPRAVLEDEGYFMIPVQPVMGMTDVDRWRDFTEYLSSMETKYSKKVKNARKKLEAAGITITYERDVDRNIERLHHLYLTVARRIAPHGEEIHQEVSRRAQTTVVEKWKTRWMELPGLLTNLPRRMKARELNKEFFRLFYDAFRDQVDIISLRGADGIAAYTVNFHDGDVYYSLFSGMDYEGDIPSVYRTLLSSKIERAIERGVRTIEFGRISLLTKAELGAYGRPLLFCAKVVMPFGIFLNPLGRFLSKKAPLFEAPVRHVFRDTENSENAWYKDNWESFYTKSRIVKAYDSNISLLGIVKGGERNLHQKAIDMLDLRARSHVIDLCCGTGAFALAIANAVGEGGRVYGIDLSSEMLSRGQMKDHGNRVDFRLMDALQTDFADETFDAVTIIAALHEIPSEQRAVLLAEGWRILKAGGKLLVGEHFVSENPLAKIIQKAVFRIVSKQPERATFSDLIEKGLATEITQAGFKVTETKILPLGLFHLLIAEKISFDLLGQEMRDEQTVLEHV